VKNEAGELNLDSLRAVKEAEDVEDPKKSDTEKEKTEMPDIQVDLLELKIDKVIYKDYSKGSSPKVKEYNVNIDEQYEDISDPKSFMRLIVIKALKNTTIAKLTSFNVDKLKKGLTGTVKKTAEMAQKTTDRALEAGKDASGKVREAAGKTVEKATDAGKDASEKIQESTRGSVEKAADSIKKLLPFGNKEKK
jgi:hypothetical protein